MAVAGRAIDPLAGSNLVAGFAEGPLRPGCDELAGLRAAICAAGLDRPPATILVTGPMAGAGTTAVAVGLAGELARDLSRQVLLIDADVRSPGVASLLEVDARYDLADVLETRADADEAILHSEVDNLFALVMRPHSVTGASRITAEQLASRAANEALGAIERAFAYVVIDAGATEESAAARVLAGRATGVVLVLPAGVTRTRARAARETVEGAGGKVLGAVLTGTAS
jgi:Mrp family chromosome partitioning ATPase